MTEKDALADEKNVHFVLKVDGMEYVGDFTFKRPTIKERAAIGVATARRNGDLQNVPASTNVLNTALSYFEVCVKARPSWFKDPESLKHETVIYELYNQLMEFLREREETSPV